MFADVAGEQIRTNRNRFGVAQKLSETPARILRGGTASGVNTVSYATPLPATYTVDYVKAWR